MSIDVRTEFLRWLEGFLPSRYFDDDHSFKEDWGLRREYQVALFEAGWLQPHWEPALGGRALTPEDSLAIRLAEAEVGAPKLFAIGNVHVVAPTLRIHANVEQRERLLVPALRGDERWCLGMSEPEAGSDLGSLRTRGKIVDDLVVIDGRKIWTSQAHWAKWCLLYCRTDDSVPKHMGISCFTLDMESEGVVPHPIRMADDNTEQFCEVELTDVHVALSNMVGGPGDGWHILTSALTDERDMLWLMNYAALLRIHRRLPSGLAEKTDLGEQLGRSLADAIAVRAVGKGARARETRSLSNPEFLTLKLMCSDALLRGWDVWAAAGGLSGITDRDLLPDEFEAVIASIYGGTSEIQRDIIGEHALRASALSVSTVELRRPADESVSVGPLTHRSQTGLSAESASGTHTLRRPAASWIAQIGSAWPLKTEKRCQENLDFNAQGTLSL